VRPPARLVSDVDGVEAPQGHSVILPAQSEQELLIDFKPTTSKAYVAFLKVRASEQCPDVVVSLEGEGVDSVLTWEPALVDCGFSPPNYEIQREVTFKNAGLSPVTVSNLVGSTGEYRAVPGPLYDGTAFTVPWEDTMTGPTEIKVEP
jgi:hypothetical protein